MRKLFLSLCFACLSIIVLPVSSVFAAPVVTGNAQCVEEIAPLRINQQSSDVLNTRCFATFSEAIAFATSGAVTLSASATPKDLTAAQLNQASAQPAITTVIGILYWDSNYGGASLSITTGGSRCGSSYDYGIASMPSGWDNVVSSLIGGLYSCNYTRLYTNTSYGGYSQCYNGNSSYVGNTMNDQTSSVRWSFYNPC